MMNAEEQCCTWAQALRFAELDMPEMETEYNWHLWEHLPAPALAHRHSGVAGDWIVPAYTSTEMGTMIVGAIDPVIGAARAEVLLYLLENKLITLTTPTPEPPERHETRRPQK